MMTNCTPTHVNVSCTNMQSSAIVTLTTLMHRRTQKFLVDTFSLYSVALHASSVETSGSHLTFKMCPFGSFISVLIYYTLYHTRYHCELRVRHYLSFYCVSNSTVVYFSELCVLCYIIIRTKTKFSFPFDLDSNIKFDQNMLHSFGDEKIWIARAFSS